MKFHCLDPDCAVSTHCSPSGACPACNDESMSDDEHDELMREDAAAAYDEYLMYGDDDDATYNPHTGWSEPDYPARGSARNEAGEPYLD